MSKIVVLVFSLGFFFSSLSFADSDERCKSEKIFVQLILTGAHTALFGVDNLYKKALDSADVKNWHDAIDCLRTFALTQGVSKYLKRFRKEIRKAAESLKSVDYDLVDAVKGAYDLKGKEGFYLFKARFDQVSKKAYSAKMELGERTDDADTMLRNALEFIEATAEKAKRDMNK